MMAAMVSRTHVGPWGLAIALDGLRVSRWQAVAPWLLAVSAVASVVISTFTDPIDLHIYVLGGAALDNPSALYDVAYLDPAHGETMPFVYPPFAAMVLYPLHFVPFWLVALAWRVGVIAGVYAVVRLCQQMMGVADKRTAMLWTAGALWLEPIVGNVKHATIGVFLMLLVMYAAHSKRWWLSGLLVGLGAGIKLTPAIAGLYFVGIRRWATAAFSAVAFLATLAVSYVVAGDRVRFFFEDFIGRDGLFTIGNDYNQSWRGGIARVLGYDAGTSPHLIVAIGVTGVLSLAAWWALGSAAAHRDQLGSLLVVMLFGLLASPVSWTAHWVWLVPLLVWLLHGPWSHRPGARVLWWAWLIVTFAAIPNQLAQLQTNRWEISRPWYEAWAGLVYPALTLATLGWIVATAVAIRRDAALTAAIPMGQSRHQSVTTAH
ncbi:mannosyltransferase [Mycolicibacterium hodleri]